MSRFLMTIAVAAGLVIAAANCTAVNAQDKKKAISGDATPEKYLSASSIEYRTTLGLPFDSLATLGTRIEQARTGVDPVALAAAANELAVAEKVSGKTAALTSKALMEEAIKMATMRKSSAELKAVALMTGEEARKDLEVLAEKAIAHEKEMEQKAKIGERTKGITQELVINNNSNQHVKIYYNNAYLGEVRPFGHQHFGLHDHSDHWDVVGRGCHGGYWHAHQHGDFGVYTLNLNP